MRRRQRKYKFSRTDLKAEYLFNSGSMSDSSGNGHTATNINATQTTDHLGNANSAMSFNGIDATLNCNSVLLPTTIWSTSLWVKLLSTSAGHYLGQYTYSQAGRTVLSSSSTYFRFSLSGDQLNYTGSFAVGQWYHIVCILNGSSKKIFFNAKQVASDSNGTSTYQGNNTFLGSTRGGGTGNNFANVCLGYPRIFTGVKTNYEIKALKYNKQ